MAMTALGIVMASAGNGPDLSKARAILDFLRGEISREADYKLSSDEAKTAAAHYADHLLSQALENLRLLRSGGQ